MEIFLDSGSIAEIEMTMNWLNISGITTNPKISTPENALQIAKRFKLPTSIQIDCTDPEQTIKMADELDSEWSVIKVPVSSLEIGKKIINKGTKVNFTLCFDLYQVICATNLQAEYASIFVGRLLDQKVDATEVIKKCTKYIKNTQSKTKIIAASIRNVEQLEMAAAAGAHIATVPAKIILEYANRYTQAGVDDFMRNRVV